MYSRIIAGVALILFLSGLLIADAVRPSKWAVPLKLSGVTNFYKVTPFLYRGAQPSRKGMQELKKLGIKTVVNLRQYHSDKKKIKNLGFNYVEIPINTFNLGNKEVLQFLKVVKDQANHPIFVHCAHGADRTGTVNAVYRIIFENWTKEEAIDEMVKGNYNYHSVFKNLLTYIRGLDIEEMKKNLNQ